MPLPYYIMFSVLMVSVVVYLALVLRLVSYLRRVHPDVWIRLGRPAIPNFAEHAKNPWPFVESAFRTASFIFGGRYKQIEDGRLISLVRLIHLAFIAIVVFFAATVLTGQLGGRPSG